MPAASTNKSSPSNGKSNNVLTASISSKSKSQDIVSSTCFQKNWITAQTTFPKAVPPATKVTFSATSFTNLFRKLLKQPPFLPPTFHQKLFDTPLLTKCNPFLAKRGVPCKTKKKLYWIPLLYIMSQNFIFYKKLSIFWIL